MRERHRLNALLLPTLLLIGCTKPAPYLYDPGPGSGLPRARTLAPDPRKDLLFLLKDKLVAEPGPMRDLALHELTTKGYQILPGESADQAELWVDVIAFVDARKEAGGGTGAPRSEGGMGHDGGGRGGARGAHGGMAGGRTGGAMPRGDRDAFAKGFQGKPSAEGPGVVLVVQLVDPKSHRCVWYGRMDLDQALKLEDRAKPQTLQDHIHRFLAPVPEAPKPVAE